MPNDLPRDTVYVGTGYDTDLTPSAHRDTTPRRRDYEDERLARSDEDASDENPDAGLIRTLTDRVDQLTNAAHHTGRQLLGTAAQRANQAFNEAQQAVHAADLRIEAAINYSDGKAASAAGRQRVEALARLDEADQARRQLHDAARAMGDAPPQQQVMHPDAARRVESFQRRYDLAKMDAEDRAIVHALDDAIAAEGHLPHTPAYWRELEDRLDRRGIRPSDEGAGRRRQQADRGNFRLDPAMVNYLRSEGLDSVEGLAPEDRQRRGRLIRGWAEAAAKAGR